MAVDKGQVVNKINLIITILFILIYSILNSNFVIAATNEEANTKDTTVDSILGALADMTVDEAKKVLNLKFTRDIREKVCGFYPYTTNYVNRDEKENTSINCSQKLVNTFRKRLREIYFQNN